MHFKAFSPPPNLPRQGGGVKTSLPRWEGSREGGKMMFSFVWVIVPKFFGQIDSWIQMIRKYSKRVFIHILIVLQSIFLWHADTAVCKTSLPREKALQPVRLEYPIFQDDMDFTSLSLAVGRNLMFLKRLNPDTLFNYGPHRITCREVLNTQTLFLKIISIMLLIWYQCHSFFF